MHIYIYIYAPSVPCLRENLCARLRQPCSPMCVCMCICMCVRHSPSHARWYMQVAATMLTYVCMYVYMYVRTTFSFSREVIHAGCGLLSRIALPMTRHIGNLRGFVLTQMICQFLALHHGSLLVRMVSYYIHTYIYTYIHRYILITCRDALWYARMFIVSCWAAIPLVWCLATLDIISVTNEEVRSVTLCMFVTVCARVWLCVCVRAHTHTHACITCVRVCVFVW
jgi:hypothetical protein